VVIGFVIIVNLRLLGLFETIPYTSLRRLFPVIWAAFAVQVVSGFVLWTTKPTRYVADGAFMLKILFIVIGFALAGVYLSHARARGGGVGCERKGFLLRRQIRRPDVARMVRRPRRGAAHRLSRRAPDRLTPQGSQRAFTNASAKERHSGPGRQAGTRNPGSNEQQGLDSGFALTRAPE